MYELRSGDDGDAINSSYIVQILSVIAQQVMIDV